jgi:hypothetical protein
MALGTTTIALLLAAGVATAASAPASAPATRGPSKSVKAPPMVLPFIDDDYDLALAERGILRSVSSKPEPLVTHLPLDAGLRLTEKPAEAGRAVRLAPMTVKIRRTRR